MVSFFHCSDRKCFGQSIKMIFELNNGCDDIETGSFVNSMNMTFCVRSVCFMIQYIRGIFCNITTESFG